MGYSLLIREMKAARWNVDRIGAYASAICAVHCVLTGVALGLLSVLGLDFIGSPVTEAMFFLTAVVVGSWALIHGMRKHRSAVPGSVFVIGMGCLLVSHFAFGHGTAGGTIFSVLGGLSLLAFHWLNRRLSHGCNCSHCVGH